MILIYGLADDPPVGLLIEALQSSGQPYAFLELRALERDGIDARGSRPQLRVAGQVMPLDDVRAIYARPMAPPAQGVAPAARIRAQARADTMLAWLDADAPFVVSRPRAMQSNASKPLQIQQIGAVGFEVPVTLVTSDPDEARAFWRAHERVIFKSCSGVRSIVHELDERSAGRLDRLRDLPVQFQALVPGIDVRVHVVGEQCYAAEINSDSIDYRYPQDAGETSMQAIELPVDVAARCVSLAEAMDLPLAGVDLRRRPDGVYVCFEVNPMPAYSYFESHAGLPISQALARLLSSADH